VADLGTLTTLQASENISLSKRRVFIARSGGIITRSYLDGLSACMTSQTWSVLSSPSSNGEKLLIPLVEGTISGAVTTGGVEDVDYLVYLFYRPTGYLIASTKTSSTGTFSFSTHLNQNEIQNYTIIAFDLTKTYNAVVYDLLTPG
jgi:hypothetical protein